MFDEWIKVFVKFHQKEKSCLDAKTNASLPKSKWIKLLQQLITHKVIYCSTRIFRTMSFFFPSWYWKHPAAISGVGLVATNPQLIAFQMRPVLMSGYWEKGPFSSEKFLRNYFGTKFIWSVCSRASSYSTRPNLEWKEMGFSGPQIRGRPPRPPYPRMEPLLSIFANIWRSSLGSELVDHGPKRSGGSPW